MLEVTIAATPKTAPNEQRNAGVIQPRWIEYWKKSSAAKASTMPPSHAAPRTPIQRSQSMPGSAGVGVAGGGGGRGGSIGAARVTGGGGGGAAMCSAGSLAAS